MRLKDTIGLGLALLSWVVQPVLAQAGLPECAATCFQSALMNQTKCAPTDVACICSDAPLNAAIQGCVMGTCTVKEGLVAVNTTATMCGQPVRDKTNLLFITSIVSGVVMVIAVFIRTSVAIMQRSFGLDDMCALSAGAAASVVWVMQTITPTLGFGKDTWVPPQENIYTVLKLIYASQVSYFPCSGFTKMCFLFFFLRIFPSPRVKMMVYAMGGFTMAYTLGFMLTIIFACKPISAFWTSWDMTRQPDYCINQNTFYLVAAAINITIDIAIVLIPIPELMKLKLSDRKKVFLCAIFSVGGITIVVSCIRLSEIVRYATTTNPLYDNLMSGVYSVLELNVGVICICMPAFRRFLAHLIPNCFASSQADSNLKHYEDGTPNAKFASSKRSGRSGKKRSTLDGSLFNTTIMKTVDTKVTSVNRDEDEVQLVELQRNGQTQHGRSVNGSDHGSTEFHDNVQKPTSFYNPQ